MAIDRVRLGIVNGGTGLDELAAEDGLSVVDERAGEAGTTGAKGERARAESLPGLLMTRAEVAHELRVSIKSIDRMDNAAKIPRPVIVGRCRRWPRATILQWIAAGCPDRKTFEAGGVRRPR